MAGRLCQAFWDFMVILGAVAIIISLYAQGLIPQYLLIIALLLVPIALTIGGFSRFLTRVGLPMLSLIILSVTIGKGENTWPIFSLLLQLGILLLAFYAIFLPFRNR